MKLMEIGSRWKTVDVPGNYLSRADAARVLGTPNPRIVDLQPFAVLGTVQCTDTAFNRLAMDLVHDGMSTYLLHGNKFVGSAWVGRFDSEDTITGLSIEDMEYLQDALRIVRQIQREKACMDRLGRQLERIMHRACAAG